MNKRFTERYLIALVIKCILNASCNEIQIKNITCLSLFVALPSWQKGTSLVILLLLRVGGNACTHKHCRVRDKVVLHFWRVIWQSYAAGKCKNTRRANSILCKQTEKHLWCPAVRGPRNGMKTHKPGLCPGVDWDDNDPPQRQSW